MNNLYTIASTILLCAGALLLIIFLIYAISTHALAAYKMIRPKEARALLKKLQADRRAEKIEAKEREERLRASIAAAKLEAELESTRNAFFSGGAIGNGVSEEELAKQRKLQAEILVDVSAMPALPTRYALLSETRVLRSKKVVRNTT